MPLSHFSTNPDRPSYITIAGVSVKTWIESDQIHAEILPYNSLGIEENITPSQNIQHLDCYIDNEGRDNTAHLQDFYTTGNLRIRIDDPTGAQPSYNKVINLKNFGKDKKTGENKEPLFYRMQYYGSTVEEKVLEEKVGDVIYTWFIEKDDGVVRMRVFAKEQKQAPTPGPVDAEFARAEKMTKGIDVDGGGEAYHVRAFDKDVKVGAQITDPDNQAAIREMSVARVGGWGDDPTSGQLKLVSRSTNDQLFMDLKKAKYLGKHQWLIARGHGLNSGAQPNYDWEIRMQLSDIKKTPYGRPLGRIATFTVVQCPGDYITMTAELARSYAAFKQEVHSILQDRQLKGGKLISGEVIEVVVWGGKIIVREGSKVLGEIPEKEWNRIIDEIIVGGKKVALREGIKLAGKIIIRSGKAMIDERDYR